MSVIVKHEQIPISDPLSAPAKLCVTVSSSCDSTSSSLQSKSTDLSLMEFCNLCRKNVQLRPNPKIRRKNHVKTKKHKVNAKYYSENNDFDLIGCRYCGFDDDDNNQLICDLCESQFHIYCLDPPLPGIPEGDWACPICVKFARKNPKHDVAIALNNLDILEISQDLVCSPNGVKTKTGRKRKAASLSEEPQKEKIKCILTNQPATDPPSTIENNVDKIDSRSRPTRRKQKPSKYRTSPKSVSVSRKRSREVQHNSAKGKTKKVPRTKAKRNSKKQHEEKLNSKSNVYEIPPSYCKNKQKYFLDFITTKLALKVTQETIALRPPSPPSVKKVQKPERGGCYACKKDTNYNQMLICDGCNSEYHIYCLVPPLKSIPEDLWFCAYCKHNGIDKFLTDINNLRVDVWSDSRICQVCKKRVYQEKEDPEDKSSKLKHTASQAKSTQKQQAVKADVDMLKCAACDVCCHAECVFDLNLSKIDNDWYCPSCLKVLNGLCRKEVHANLPTDLQHVRIYDQQRQSLCSSSSSDNDSSSDSSSSSKTSDDSESGTDSDSEDESSRSGNTTVKLGLDQLDSGNDHISDLRGDFILENVEPTRPKLPYPQYKPKPIITNGKKCNAYAIIGRRVIIECMFMEKDGSCRATVPKSFGQQRPEHLFGGRIVSYNSETQQHLIIFSNCISEWLTLNDFPLVIASNYLVWAVNEIGSTRNQTKSRVSKQYYPAELFTVYGKSIGHWFDLSLYKAKSTDRLIRFFEPFSPLQFCDVKYIRDLYDSEGNLLYQGFTRRTLDKKNYIKFELKDLLFQAANELETSTRITFFHEQLRQNDTFRSKILSPQYYGMQLIDTKESFARRLSEYKHQVKTSKHLITGRGKAPIRNKYLVVNYDPLNNTHLLLVTSATKYMHQASAWRDISMLFNDLEILNTDDSLCSKSNVRSRDKLSINATNQTCIHCGEAIGNNVEQRLCRTDSPCLPLRPQTNQLLECDSCHRLCHLRCGIRNIPSFQNSSQWYCLKCSLHCNWCKVSLNTNSSILESDGGHVRGVYKKEVPWVIKAETLICRACDTLHENGQICPQCNCRIFADGILKVDGQEYSELQADKADNDILLCRECSCFIHKSCCDEAYLSQFNEKQLQPITQSTATASSRTYVKMILCKQCFQKKLKECVKQLRKIDEQTYFTLTVTQDIAPTYFDVIKTPMSLSIMDDKVKNSYNGIDSFIYDFYLICHNALLFNDAHSRVWNEAWKFYEKGNMVVDEYLFDISMIFDANRIMSFLKSTKLFQYIESKVEKPRQQSFGNTKIELRRKVQEERAEKARQENESDQWMLNLQNSAPLAPYTPYCHIKTNEYNDAINLAWIDLCAICGSGGAHDRDKMLFCADCGECFHYYCASSNNGSVLRLEHSLSWRCPSCKVCEACGNVHPDDKLIICDVCDKAYGFNCVFPKLSCAPEEGTNWICCHCLDCKSCTQRIKVKEPREEKEAKRLVEAEINIIKKVIIAKYNSQQQHCDAVVKAVYAYLNSADIRRSTIEDVKATLKDLSNVLQHSSIGEHGISSRLTTYFSKLSRLLKTKEPPMKLSWGNQLGEICEICRRNSTVAMTQAAIIDTHCRICLKRWTPGVDDQDMVQCGICFSWIHDRCDAKVLTKSVLADMDNGLVSADYICPVCRPFGMDGVEYGKILAAGMDGPTGLSSAKSADEMKEPNNEPQNQDKSSNVALRSRTSSKFSNIGKYAALQGYMQPSVGNIKSPVNSSTTNDGLGPSQETNKPGIAWNDTRVCVFCNTGEENDTLGRLLPINTGGNKKRNTVCTEWFHTKCGIWSSETSEDEFGVIRFIKNAIRRAKAKNGTSTCTVCHTNGATIGCCETVCKRSYHLRCAKLTNLWTPAGNIGGATYCFEHTSKCVNPIRFPNINDQRLLTAALPDYNMFDLSIRLGLQYDTATKADDYMHRLLDKNVDGFSRVGSLTVIQLGEIVKPPENLDLGTLGGSFAADCFDADCIYTNGYRAVRSFWSLKYPFKRCLYLCSIDIEREVTVLPNGKPQVRIEPYFTIQASDVDNEDESYVIRSRVSPDEAFQTLLKRIDLLYDTYSDTLVSSEAKTQFTQFLEFRAQKKTRASNKSIYNLNGDYFFGVAIPYICLQLETLENAVFLGLIMFPRSQRYKFKYVLPSSKAVLMVKELYTRHLNSSASQNNMSSARSEPFYSRKDTLTIMKKRSLGDDTANKYWYDETPNSGRRGKKNTNVANLKHVERVDSSELLSMLEIQYSKMLQEKTHNRVQVQRSRIHRWGLFAMRDIEANEMVVEYIGEKVRRVIADKREEQYNLNHDMGGCYMFRLDFNYIVDATHCGNVARFINHCCDPNSYAKVVRVRGEDHIIIFSRSFIEKGAEIVYDYQFPLEEDAIKCNCGSANCIGRMN